MYLSKLYLREDTEMYLSLSLFILKAKSFADTLQH